MFDLPFDSDRADSFVRASDSAAAIAAVERVVRYHEAALETMKHRLRFDSVPGDGDRARECERRIAALEAELARMRETAVSHASHHAREELSAARESLAHARATIRAQAMEIERLAAELAERS